MNGSFRVETEFVSGVHALGVSGELDQATVPDLRAPLGEVIGSGQGPVLIDLSGCEFIDSTGLSLLVEAQRKLSDLDGRRFAICCPRRDVGRLLELTGVGQALELFDARSEALDALGEGRAGRASNGA